MKKLILMSLGLFVVMLITTTGCKESFLEKDPQGVLSPSVLANQKGLEALLIAAYGELDGWSGWSLGAPWESPGSNWLYGDVYADDAYKGTDVGDQPKINSIERYEQDAGNSYYSTKWQVSYDGVSRTNDVLKVLADAVEAGTIDKDNAAQIEAEAKFLRAYFHLEAIKVFDYVPFIDENAQEEGYLIPNDIIPYAQVEADFQAAMNVLPKEPRNGQVGRATKWAAMGLLARTYMYQGKYSEAKTLLDEIINDGPYHLVDLYYNNFEIAGNNNAEAIFQIQASVNDGAGYENANFGDVLNFPYNNGPGKCCGFDQPSQNLVNAFKTTDDGLPYLKTFGLDFNAEGDDVKNDQGISSDEPFTPDTRPLDPRLDWTVGRRGIPYWDWGPHGGQSWIRNQNYAGPYSPKKLVYKKSEEGTGSSSSGWGGGETSNNYSVLRFADVILMDAECEVEVGSLDKAREYVNMVRARAANPDGFVKNDDGSDAANYVIKEYPTGGPNDPFQSQEGARDAVRFERRIELGMEGLRFWDLKRWGVAKEVLNAYLAIESKKRTYLAGAVFKDKNVRHPIPDVAIDRSEGTLKQNPGY